MTRAGLKAFLIIMFVMDAIIAVTLGCALSSPIAGISLGAAMLAAPIALFGAISAVIGSLARWSAMAERYPAVTPAGRMEPILASIAVRWRWFGINNAIEWGADEEHLHLALVIPFARGTPPISIPWGETEITRVRKNCYRLDVGGAGDGGFRLWVPEAMVKKELALRAAIEPDTEPAPLGR